MVKLLRVAGTGWLALGWAVYAIGCVLMAYEDGFFVMVRAMNPANLFNILTIAMILAPGILLRMWADRIEARQTR